MTSPPPRTWNIGNKTQGAVTCGTEAAILVPGSAALLEPGTVRRHVALVPEDGAGPIHAVAALRAAPATGEHLLSLVEIRYEAITSGYFL